MTFRRAVLAVVSALSLVLSSWPPPVLAGQDVAGPDRRTDTPVTVVVPTGPVGAFPQSVPGDPRPDTIIGSDDRARIYWDQGTYRTTQPPWRWVADLDVKFPDELLAQPCNGFLIGPRLVLTAGACVYDHDKGGYAQWVKVMPGRDSDHLPYDSLTSYEVHALAEYEQYESAEYNIGVVVLPGDGFSSLGNFSYGYFSDGYVAGNLGWLAGYPTDYYKWDPNCRVIPGCQMWYSADWITTVSERIVSHHIDTYGEAGAPIWVNDGDSYFVVAVSTGVVGDWYCNPGDNCGTRITRDVAQFLTDHGASSPVTDCRYSLTTSVTPAGGGTVSVNPASTSGCPSNRFVAGEQVNLTAVPAYGYEFVSWTGTNDNSRASTTVTMAGNRSVTARFQVGDTTPPTINFSFSAGTNTWYNTDQRVDWSLTDTQSGVQGYSYRWDSDPGGSSPAYSGSSGSTHLSSAGQGRHRLYVRAWDNRGNQAASSAGEFWYDISAPDNPTNIWSTSHSPYEWSSDPTVDVSWSGAQDTYSGVSGYSVEWSVSGITLPDTSVDTTSASNSSPPLADGNNWYVHVRASDRAGNWSGSAVHYGPFYIQRAAATGTILVTTNRQDGSWHIAGPQDYDGMGGSTLTDAPPGTYQIYWGAVADCAAPQSQTGVLTAGSSITFNGTYSCATTGTIVVTTNRQDASWHITGPQSYNGTGNDTRSALPGSYSIVWDTLSGCSVLPVETKTLIPGLSIFFNGTYSCAGNSPPSTPANPTPANGASGVSLSPTLSWSASDPDGDSVTFDLFFGTTTAPPIIAPNLPNGSYDVSNLSPDTWYYWRARARDSHGATTDGPLWSFRTASAANNPPFAPSSPTPSDGAQGVSTSPTLSWNGGDPDGDAVTYNVYFGATSPLPLVASAIGSTSYAPGSLLPATTYYWLIAARDSHGLTTQGPFWSFTTSGGGQQSIIVEAETGTFAGSMSAYSSSAASACGYAATPDPCYDDSSSVRLSFYVPQSGTYRIWGRVYAPNYNADSFNVRIDGGASFAWAFWYISGYGVWAWDPMTAIAGNMAPPPRQFSFSAGWHEALVQMRDGGARLDALLVTSNLSFTPSGAPAPCGGAPTAVATQTRTPTRTATRVPTNTWTPTRTATRVPTNTFTPSATPTPQRNCPDAYEPDDTMGQARYTGVGGSPQPRNFDSSIDVDWAYFWANAGSNYSVETLELLGGVDTVLTLLSSDGQTLATNDDWAGTRRSHIAWLAPASGWYYVRGHDFSYASVGCATSYQLQVLVETPTPTASSTARPSSTPTRTHTPTRTATPTQTASATATASSTATALPTQTATETPTASPTATPTETPTETLTASPTPTGTATAAIVNTPTSTRTVESAPARTATPTASPTTRIPVVYTHWLWLPIVISDDE